MTSSYPRESKNNEGGGAVLAFFSALVLFGGSLSYFCDSWPLVPLHDPALRINFTIDEEGSRMRSPIVPGRPTAAAGIKAAAHAAGLLKGKKKNNDKDASTSDGRGGAINSGDIETGEAGSGIEMKSSFTASTESASGKNSQKPKTLLGAAVSAPQKAFNSLRQGYAGGGNMGAGPQRSESVGSDGSEEEVGGVGYSMVPSDAQEDGGVHARGGGKSRAKSNGKPSSKPSTTKPPAKYTTKEETFSPLNSSGTDGEA
jgi:hypothetical protein